MAKTWVLDVETKGTGAEVVPLEKARKKRAPEPALNLVRLNPAASADPPAAAEDRQPRRFKVVDLMTRETLAEHASTQQALDTLKRVRSIVDVSVFVWQPRAQRWRLLTLDEQRALWAQRHQPVPA